ncbi:MAG: ATPase [Clostridia bacterium]|nr:ATPase [Clostridia bacterium]
MLKGIIMENGGLFLGIELGSTRIKAVLIDSKFAPVASGSYGWENKFEDGWWTYSLDEALVGLRESFRALSDDHFSRTGKRLENVCAIGVSAMMHGYLALDENMKPLAPFRTWRNARTQKASDELTELFGVRVPQRWSVSNLYQCMLNGDEHVKRLDSITTLSGYVHRLLTGRNEVGLNEASGMFPVRDGDYDENAVKIFDSIANRMGYSRNVRSVFPKVRPAGYRGAVLTEEGARLLDPDGDLRPGIPLCPPEGDAGTGMVATNCVRPGTCSLSAGTSVFALLINDRPLSGIYREADVMKTPDGKDVALVHSNNGCTEIDNWVGLFYEFASLCGADISKSDLYSLLYSKAASAPPDCGRITAFNCVAYEPIEKIEAGFPLVYRNFDSALTLAGFFRAQISAIFAPLKAGLKTLEANEGVRPRRVFAHGGLFKVPGIAQQILADALDAPVSVMNCAGEGGAYGMALLAAYMIRSENKPLADWLDGAVFPGAEVSTLYPDPEGVRGFRKFIENHNKGLKALRALGGE